MLPTTEIRYDASMATIQGQRERQEDSVASDFASGEPFGFVVLADGMGGHAAGDVASKIVVTEIFSALKLASGDPETLESEIGTVLTEAAQSANECVGLYAGARPQSEGMGATLLAPVLFEDRLYWVSVGDSPLYLFRNNNLQRLNENHALESQIDYVVENGIMDRDEALAYPDQSCLTSVLIGQQIAQLDCRSTPLRINPGDILIAASDGLQFLDDEQIEQVLRFSQKRSAEKIGAALVNAVETLADPNQDNMSLCVIKALAHGEDAESELEEKTLTRSRIRGNASITIIAKVARPKRVTG